MTSVDNKMYPTFTAKCFKTEFDGIPAYTFSMTAAELVAIYYVARRGIDEEEGAVQRVLSKSRIDGIREYVEAGNVFFNSFIVNWTESNTKPTISETDISFPLIQHSVQVIDGQHRLSGLDEAIKRDQKFGKVRLIVTLCIDLVTKQAAQVFLNINTEQKPVNKSLIYDLFGEISDNEELSINRARDIAENLNADVTSPFYKRIKFPGTPISVGTIELSTFVSSLKRSLEHDGIFRQVNLRTFEHQRSVLFNFFTSLMIFYQSHKLWTATGKNPFLKASGFNGAMDYLVGSLILRCAEAQSFSVAKMTEIMKLDASQPLVLDELKGLDGKTARKKVHDYLQKSLRDNLPDMGGYEF